MHQQHFAASGREGFADGPDGVLLVVAIDNRRCDGGLRQGLATIAATDQGFKLRFLVEALHVSGWIALVIPEAMAVAVGEEDQGPLAVAPLQSVRIEPGLLLTEHRIFAAALGFHQRQGFAVIAPEHVIDKTLIGLIGHALHLVLMGAALAVLPARFLQIQVDVAAARLELADLLLRLGGRLVGLTQGGDFGAQAVHLLLGGQCHQPLIAQLVVPLGQLLGEGFQLFPGLGLLDGGGIPRRQPLLIEAQALDSGGIQPVGEGQPAQHLKQFGGGEYGITGADRIAAVHGLVAEILEQPEAVHLPLGQIAEAGGKNQISEAAVAEGLLQLAVVFIHPLHQQLNRAAGVEAGGAGIAEGSLLDAHGLGVQLGPLAGDEGLLGRVGRHVS